MTSHFRCSLTLFLVCLWIFSAGPARAQDWSSEIGLNYGWLDLSGNSDSFRSQMNLRDGASLEYFQLSFLGEDSSIREFKIRAWGFGDAETSSAFRLDLKTANSFRFQLSYDHGDNFFALSNPGFANTRENWNLDRWMADLSWEGWRHWGLGLSYHRSDRQGSIEGPDFGLNELYPVKLDLDETMDDIALRLESHGLPIYLLFEQSYAQYTSRTRPSVNGNLAISNPEDPDELSSIESSTKDSVDIPSSRFMASWSTERWEGLVSLLYSDADLDATGGLTRSYSIDGGNIGEMNFIDDLVSSTQRDMLSGALRLGFAISPTWAIRLATSYRDSSGDSALFGRRLLRSVNPAGDIFEVEASVDDSGYYDFTDSSSRLTLEYGNAGLNLRAGIFTGSRDVSWQHSNDNSEVSITRDSDGFLLGLGWNSGPVDASIEYENGTFEHYVFRTDPEKVDRLNLRLRTKLSEAWRLKLHGRFEQADNPEAAAGLDRDSLAWGLNLGWTSKDARQSLALSFDRNSLTSDTSLVLPGGEAGLSQYDLDLSTISLSGHSQVGITHIMASVNWIEDQGESFPITAWNASGRIGWDASPAIRIGVFTQYWDYDEDASNLDDFRATRYGVFLHWSSQS